MFVPCIAGLCIENQHCALGFVIVLTRIIINTLTKPNAQCWFSVHKKKNIERKVTEGDDLCIIDYVLKHRN
jgi:hypothetical protein